jgi:hypothetical protein
MSRYRVSAEDRAKSNLSPESRDARAKRREAELALLDRLHAELAMPEWYPHQ